MSGGNAEAGSSANSYEILAKLAVGGMAEVFLARGKDPTGAARYCVLKRILAERAADPKFVEMFLDEARLAAQLQHTNIAQVYDLGTLDDSYFYTLEYVHGETVRGVLYRAAGARSPLPYEVVLGTIAGVAAGLQHAHERIGQDGRHLEIVHRDISPSNLILGHDGTVKIIDFGIAKAAHRLRETKAGIIKGKIGYLSPEQCRGIPLDCRSDLFSLGVVMWEMLTLDRLYRRGTDLKTMQAIVAEPPPAPSTRVTGIPPQIDAIVLRLLAKDRDARYASGADVVADVERAAADLGLALAPDALGAYMRASFGERTAPWVELERLDETSSVSILTAPIVADDVLVQGQATGLLESVQLLPGGAPADADVDEPSNDAPDPRVPRPSHLPMIATLGAIVVGIVLVVLALRALGQPTDDTPPPVAKPAPGSPIDDVIATLDQHIAGCARQQPTTLAAVELGITVDGEGRVTVVESEHGEDPVVACVTKLFAEAQFPPGAPATYRRVIPLD